MRVSTSALGLSLALVVVSCSHMHMAHGFTASPAAGSTKGGRIIQNEGAMRRKQQLLQMSAVEDGVDTSSTSSSTSTRTGRSQVEINTELQSGRTLEGGATMDFAGVKDTTSRSERALAVARDEFLGGGSATALYGRDEDGVRLIGINDDVVREVGREVGQFITTYDKGTVQGCAEWLRSRAAPGLFETKPASTNGGTDDAYAKAYAAATSTPASPSPEQIETYRALLDEAYVESGVVTEAFAKTFYLGTKLMPPAAQRAIWAIYVWCRRTDEIVDAPREPDDPNMLTDLSAWEIRTENLWKYGEVVDVLDLPLLDVRANYPKLEITPFVDMVRGMLMDIPDLGQDRYDTFDELHLYCYRVAGTVGLMSMPIFGCADGFTEAEAKEPALSLGVAFQITNILRDVGEDATTRGRVYLPQKDMERFGVTEQQLFDQRVDENYIALMKYEIGRARMYYERAKRGVPMLSPEGRLPVQSSLDCYGKILDKIEENGYDTLTKRAYVSKWEKLFEIPFSWYRTQEIAKALPLPWDSAKEDESKSLSPSP